MIKATELRIGNWVEVENYKNIQLENVHPKGTTHGDDQYLISMLKPIPLTEEILLKCGFRKISSVIYIKNKITINVFSDVGVCFSLNERFSKIKSLHQLQNLYWCLAGEELEINL